MKYIFNSQFLKVIPPYTSFGDVWEAFCLSLLQAEDGHHAYVSLKAPDRGVDILKRQDNTAIQCKADERGASGTISPAKSTESLRTAVDHKESIGWVKYAFASNANYSGVGIESIFETAVGLALDKNDVKFMGPEYWSEICDKHLDKVKHFLDYRLLYSESEVEEAFRKSKYYEEYIEEYVGLIQGQSLRIEVANNKTPLILSLPFSSELTIKHCLNVAKSLLGIDLDAENYNDIGTSARPRLSITLDQKKQPFDKKLGKYNKSEVKRLKLWIQTVYSYEGDSKDGDEFMQLIMRKTTMDISKSDAKSQTLERFEKSIQNKMWNSVNT